mmetsp:Transcript_45058/g.117131  ORF Transcript_45058/g.117131 Transcript_45058/m.117131 type:complete len:283 (+) Transcript_45058:584-1432(+)
MISAVARWSATVCWNARSSALRASPAAFSATCASDTCWARSSRSAESCLTVPFSAPICASRSLLSRCFSRSASSFASMSFLQSSVFWYSFVSCCFRSAIILSIISFTFSMPPLWVLAASSASCQPAAVPQWRRAVDISLSAAAAWAPAPAWVCRAAIRRGPGGCPSTCRKLTVREKMSRASSCERIVMASAMALTSSARVATRSSNSLPALSHCASRSTRNFSSAESASPVLTTSSLAWATLSFVSASSADFVSTAWLATCISSIFTALRRWKEISAATSDF